VLLLDPLYKDRNQRMPKVTEFTPSQYTEGVEELVLNHPTALFHTGDAGILARSTPFSYLTESAEAPDEKSVPGPFIVAAEVELGEGTLVLIADSSLFINSMLDRGDNMAFLEALSRGQVYLDEAHSIPSRLTMFKTFLIQTHSFSKKTEIRYGLASLALLAIFKVKWTGERVKEGEDEVEMVLEKHPEWDRRLLEELDEARRRDRGDS